MPNHKINSIPQPPAPGGRAWPPQSGARAGALAATPRAASRRVPAPAPVVPPLLGIAPTFWQGGATFAAPGQSTPAYAPEVAVAAPVVAIGVDASTPKTMRRKIIECMPRMKMSGAVGADALSQADVARMLGTDGWCVLVVVLEEKYDAHRTWGQLRDEGMTAAVDRMIVANEPTERIMMTHRLRYSGVCARRAELEKKGALNPVERPAIPLADFEKRAKPAAVDFGPMKTPTTTGLGRSTDKHVLVDNPPVSVDNGLGCVLNPEGRPELLARACHSSTTPGPVEAAWEEEASSPLRMPDDRPARAKLVGTNIADFG